VYIYGVIQKISAPISVTSFYDHHRRAFRPTQVIWEGRDYPLLQIGLHHTYRQGRTLYHVFSVNSQTLFFKLIFNTDTLHWMLEEIADENP
jgi:hypothetical protein